MANIAGLATLDTPAGNDYLPIYDASADTDKKITILDMIGDTGTWTPTLTAVSGSGTIASNGAYRVLLDVCFCWFDLTATSVGSLAGPLNVGGLPFAAAAGNGFANGAIMIDGVTMPANTSTVTYQTSSGNQFVLLIASGGTAAHSQLEASAIDDGTVIRGIITYIKA